MLKYVEKQGIKVLGLAECLIALIGQHHGESDEAQALGLKIVGHMRELTDSWQKEWYKLSNGKKVHLNWGIIGTPKNVGTCSL